MTRDGATKGTKKLTAQPVAALNPDTGKLAESKTESAFAAYLFGRLNSADRDSSNTIAFVA